MLAIGLMSGTSLDGADCALVNITEDEKFELVDFYTLPYENEFKEKIRRNLQDETSKVSELCSLNFELPYKFVEAIDIILKRNNLKYSDISFVASHGQTMWHSPHPVSMNVASTLQIGDGQIISMKTGITTVFNFRNADVVAGGEGAPLVPMFEYMYFKDKDKNIILQNIGGMGNLTYLKKNANINEVVAFDTGPGNVMIDYYMQKYFNKAYDENGLTASSGLVINKLLEFLLKDEFVNKEPPKSTGRERYSSEYLEKIAKDFEFDKYDKSDIITTITEFTCQSIIFNYKNFIKDYDKIIVSGGGCHNKYIMNRLNEELDNKVFSLDEDNLNSDAKEALAFCVLGYLTLNNKAGNVKKATGAKYDCILGEISYAKVVK